MLRLFESPWVIAIDATVSGCCPKWQQVEHVLKLMDQQKVAARTQQPLLRRQLTSADGIPCVAGYRLLCAWKTTIWF
jgi:coenzyme F420-reducing hydrogenase gamma subunit